MLNHYIVFFILAITLPSCTTTRPANPNIFNEIQTYKPDGSFASVYLYRNQYVESARSIKWALDGKKKGYLAGYSHVRINMPKGAHMLSMGCVNGKSPEIEMKLEAGKRYYIKYALQNLVSCKLDLMEEKEALLQISQTKASKHILITEEDIQADKVEKQIATNSETSAIFIYNNSNIANSISLSINSSPIAALRDGQYLKLKLKPGSYEIKSDGGTAKLNVDTLPGQVYFVRQEVTLFGGRNWGVLPNTKLFQSDQAFFNDFQKSLPTYFAEIDFQSKPKNLFYLQDGATYQGEFENDYPKGKGKIVYTDPDYPIESYEGDVKYMGGYEGEGTITQRDGIIYTGQVSAQKANGKGVYRFPNGGIWESTYKNNSPFGFSKVIFPDGTYEGELLNWKFNGRGVLSTSKGVFDGVFKDGVFYSGKVFNSDAQLISIISDGKKVDNQSQKALNNIGSGESNLLVELLKFTVEATNIIVQSYNKSQSSQLRNIKSDLSEPDSSLNSPNTYVDVGSTGRSKSSSTSSSHVTMGCSSDFSCGIGSSCVKARFSSNGVCMRTVDANGSRIYNSPSLESVGVRASEGCRFNSDCAIGFNCDNRLKVCIKP